MKRVRSKVFLCGLGILAAINGRVLDAQGARGGSATPVEVAPVQIFTLPSSQQAFDSRQPDPTVGPVVAGAPFSGEATTTVTQTLGDGTRIERRVTAKLYRDSTGRLRREQTVIGLDRLSSTPPQTIITFDSVPGDTTPFVLDPIARVATRAGRAVRWYSADSAVVSYGLAIRAEPRNATENTPDPERARELERAASLLRNPLRLGVTPDPVTIPADITPVEEPLGTRQMEGVQVVGKRTTTLIPLGRIGNDAPIRITDERWESPELTLIVYSRFSDPRTGVVEYRLTNVNRAEPRADLFAVPADYKVWEPRRTLRYWTPQAQAPAPATGQRGGRGN